MAICKLCKQEKELIGRSHIIPDFMYKQSGLYDEKHRLRYFSVGELIDGKPPSLPQSGVHEGGILCANCDNVILGTLEQYAKIAIYGGGKLNASECPEVNHYQNDEGIKFSLCTNLNYKKYKLFLLSILWRASISSRPFFEFFSVGVEHEETLRKMIYDNDPKNYYDYPVTVITTASDKQFSADMIIEPSKIVNQEGMESYYFIISGFIYVFKLGVYGGNLDELKRTTINEQDELTILQMAEGQSMELIKKYCGV